MEWAETYRHLPPSSALRGPFRIDRTPWMREILDACTDPSVREIVVVGGSQIGKTENLVLNVIGYLAQMRRANILLVMPTLTVAEEFAKDRIDSLRDYTPALHEIIPERRTRDSDAAVLHRVFRGGSGGGLRIAGANSPSSLASWPCTFGIGDEVSRWTRSAGVEGDPLGLMRARLKTFWDAKLIMVSSPGIEGACRITEAFLETDQRIWKVVCPLCGHRQRFVWRSENGGIRFEDRDPRTARYKCEGCSGLWDEVQKRAAVHAGAYEVTNPTAPPWKRGFRFPGIASTFPGASMELIVDEFLQSDGQPERRKVFVNTCLTETWKPPQETLPVPELMLRRERWEPGKVPPGGAVIVLGIDTQDDRLEIEAVCFGRRHESWGLEYTVIRGDPAGGIRGPLWRAAEAYLDKTWLTPTGHRIPICATAIDSGGHHTMAVYSWAKRLAHRNVFAIRGVGNSRRGQEPDAGKPSKNNLGGTKVYPIGVDTVKNTVASLLTVGAPGPGYQHMNADEGLGYTPEWFRGFASEHAVVQYDAFGAPYRVWRREPDGAVRNEPWDCRIYAFGALAITGIDLDLAVAQLTRDEEERALRRVSSRSSSDREVRANRSGRPGWLDRR